MKKLLAVAVLFAVLVCACSKPEAPPQPAAGGDQAPPGQAQPAPAKKLSIAVIPKGTSHTFWKSVQEGAARAGAELGVEVIWKGPMTENDREAQIKIMEDFISRGVSGISLAPLDDTALRMPVQNAIRSGIPVVIFDSDLKSEDYVSFVATDNYNCGVMAGEEMVRLLGGQGRVLVLRFQEGSASTTKREQGFLDVIAKNPGIKVVSQNQFGGATGETCYRSAENLISPLRQPDGSLAVDGIFCPNEPTVFGMLRALQDIGAAGKVKLIGVDTTTLLLDSMRKGEIAALVSQDPRKMGFLAVKVMVDHLNGTPVEKRVDTGATLVTPDNVDTPEIQALTAPPKN